MVAGDRSATPVPDVDPVGKASAPCRVAGEVTDPEASIVRMLTGVYHADGGLRGELAYVVGRALGRAHCALCDITHGTVSEKASWSTCRAALPVPFEVVHRNERSAEVHAATEGWTPCVVAHTDGGVIRLVGPDELEACDGEPASLVAAIERAAAAAGLRWS